MALERSEAAGLDPARWSALMNRTGLPPLQAVFSDLQRRHGERHRHYHTADHINALLRHLDRHSGLATAPDRIELAIWFHDAIYKPLSKTNEADSADLARTCLSEHLSDSDIDWIAETILLTANHGYTEDPDTALMLDLDLSILATDAETYDRYTSDIRREYRWVPGPLYRKGRATILRHFLDMPRLYKTDALAAIWEAPARSNLSRELAVLG